MKKTIILMALASAAIICISCKNNTQTAESKALPSCNSDTPSIVIPDNNGEMFQINVISDAVNPDGSRTICATPCEDVCSRQIEVTVKDGTILNVTFTGGCPGNTTGVSNLVVGMTVEEAIKRMEGIDCAGRGTSCPDQLSKVLKLFV